ncbi:MAG: hypothetical protein WA908_06305, partial [Pontixanthobacter sp.]
MKSIPTASIAAALVSVTTAIGAVAQDYRSAFHPDTMDDRAQGAPNAVMVLATPHLSQLPDNFRVEMVKPLVARLVEWQPTAIATEDNAGLLCDKMRRMLERYERAIDRYCYDPAIAAKVTGLTVPQANTQVETMLADWPADPAPGMRRKLAALFLAAGEPTSALVQWLRLPESERIADGFFTDELAAILRERQDRENESDSVAARVAAQSDLERVYSVDDQSTYIGEAVNDPAFGNAVMAAWDNPASKTQREEGEALAKGLNEPGGLLAMYRAYNAPSHMALKYRSDFGAA